MGAANAQVPDGLTACVHAAGPVGAVEVVLVLAVVVLVDEILGVKVTVVVEMLADCVRVTVVVVVIVALLTD